MNLTKHPAGSLRELWALSLPLMLSSLSTMSMIFADRWLLAHYSTAAHNAAVVATTLGWAFIFGWVVLANIAEIFVAQYNGAGLRHKLAEPVWQMIWLSLGSILFFLPVAIWGSELFYGTGIETQYERDYFSTMLMFGPFYPLYAALCSFFVGQGKTRLVTVVVVAANIVNVTLDQILIFGVEGWVPSLGVKGAAIATSLATFIQSAILIVAFFSKTHREQHGTLSYHIKPKLLWECLTIGFPNAIFFVSEVLAFAVFYALMKTLGESYITIVGICQNIWILTSFFAEGTNKAIATIVGNLIGSGKTHLVHKVIKAGVGLNVIFFFLLFGALYFGTDLIIDQFLPTATPAFINEIRGSLETCLFFMAIYMFFEVLRFQFAGVLLAAGDTVFLFIAGSSMVWILMVLPLYFLVIPAKASVETAFSLWIVYSAVSSVTYLWRIYQGNWQSIVISSELKVKAK